MEEIYASWSRVLVDVDFIKLSMDLELDIWAVQVTKMIRIMLFRKMQISNSKV